MTEEIMRRRRCLTLYPEPPSGLEAAVQRACARANAGEIGAQLIEIERICLAAQLGVLRAERAAQELTGEASTLAPALLRGLLDRLARTTSDAGRAFLLRRALAALPAAAAWNLAEFEMIALIESAPREAADGEGPRLRRQLASVLGAGLLAPPRVRARLAETRTRPNLGALLRWVERTGAPMLPIDRTLKEVDEATPMVIRQRQEEIILLIAQDLLIG